MAVYLPGSFEMISELAKAMDHFACLPCYISQVAVTTVLIQYAADTEVSQPLTQRTIGEDAPSTSQTVNTQYSS